MTINILKNKELLQAKKRAATIHLGISLLIFAVLASLIYFYFYSGFHFTVSGGVQGILLMFFVDAVLGPFITLVIYNPKKPRREIISDFLIIATIQISALFYGIYTVYTQRPEAIIWYEYGHASSLTYRDTLDYPEIRKALQNDDLVYLGRSALFFYQVENGQEKYLNPKKIPVEIIEKASNLAKTVVPTEEKIYLEQHPQTWLMPVLGKYKGVYLQLDKNFNYVNHFGEEGI